jgi:hypothetical protein
VTYEYKVVPSDGERAVETPRMVEHLLNGLALSGWELVAVTHWCLYLRRPKEEQT